jgi:hypothetical protein
MAVGVDKLGRQASTLRWMIFVSGLSGNFLFAEVPTAGTRFQATATPRQTRSYIYGDDRPFLRKAASASDLAHFPHGKNGAILPPVRRRPIFRGLRAKSPSLKIRRIHAGAGLKPDPA